jgi:hypothetical protein
MNKFPEQSNSALKDFLPAKMKKIQEACENSEKEEVKVPPVVEKPAKVEKKPTIAEKPVKKLSTKENPKKTEEDLTALMSPEEAESTLEPILPSSIITKLKETS